MCSEHHGGHHAGDAWRLRVTVSELVYVLTAADILQPQLSQSADTIRSTSDGCCLPSHQLLADGEAKSAVLQT